jgi:hypothetical protein
MRNGRWSAKNTVLRTGFALNVIDIRLLLVASWLTEPDARRPPAVAEVHST